MRRGSEVRVITALGVATGTTGPPDVAPRTSRLRFVPAQADAFLQELRRQLETPAAATIIVDISAVDHLDPAALRALAAAVESARSAGVVLYCDGARPAVYKALHIAKLAPLLMRAPRDTESDSSVSIVAS